jgi:hypothetical protein
MNVIWPSMREGLSPLERTCSLACIRWLLFIVVLTEITGRDLSILSRNVKPIPVEEHHYKSWCSRFFWLDTSVGRVNFVQQLYNLRHVLDRDEETGDTKAKVRLLQNRIDQHGKEYPMCRFISRILREQEETS